MIRFLLLPVKVARRFREERLAQTAAALSFATLVGLIPMIAVAVAVLGHFPLADTMADSIRKFLLANFLPEKAGAMIARYVTAFAHKAERLTWISVATLIVTALAQMLTIEHAFNAIWSVRESRALMKRVTMHLMTLSLGPVVFGASIAATTYLASASLGLIGESRMITGGALRSLSFVTVASLFALLYWKVPNRAVAGAHAIAGGLLAALGFGLMQWLFATYVVGIPSYRIVYGTFAAIPIFLLWLYLSWSVILIGALITAQLGRPGR